MNIEEFSLEEGQVQEEESWGKEWFPDVVKGRAQAAQIQAQIQQFVANGQKTSKIWEFLLQKIKDEKLLVLLFEMYKNWASIEELAYVLCPFIGSYQPQTRCEVNINKISDYISWLKSLDNIKLRKNPSFKKVVYEAVLSWDVGGVSQGEISPQELKNAIFKELTA